MKKTFKIALLLCLLIAMLLPMASCLKQLPLWRAVAVDTLNGMNAAQLYKKFVNDFKSSSTCEIQINRTYFSTKTSTTIKANENAFHYFSKKTSEIDYYPVEFYLFDDFAYLRRETYKYKCHRADVDDLFGENCIDSYMNAIIQEVPESYYAALEDTQLYLKNGVYFFTVSLVVPEQDNTSVTETVYFDESGTILKIVNKNNDYGKETNISIKYDIPVVITPPTQDYIEVPKLPENDNEIHQLYVDICEKIQNADYLQSSTTIPGVAVYNYERCKHDRYIGAIVDTSYFEQWIVEQKGYIRENRETFLEAPIDDAFLELFNTVEGGFPIFPFSQDELQNLDYSYDLISLQTTLSFDKMGEPGHRYHYEYAFFKGMDVIDVIVTHYVDDVKHETSTFVFLFRPNVTIILPQS